MNEYINWHDINSTDGKENIDQDSVNQFITMSEIENAIKDTTASKVPGIDGITNRILKNGIIVAAPLLCDI